MRGGDRIKADQERKELRIERTLPADGFPVLREKIVLPQPFHLRGARRIRRYYRAQSRAFSHYCEHALLIEAEREALLAREASAPFSCREAELNYVETYEDGCVWSLYTQSREPLENGATGVTRRGDTWDKRTGLPLPISEFFPAKFAWKRALLAFASDEVRRREQEGFSRFSDGVRSLLRRRFNPMNYYLTPEGLVFFYPVLSIAPAAEGIVTFCLPYGEGGLRER